MAISTTAAILGSAAIGAGTSLIGGSMQSGAARDAGRTAAAASDRAAELQRQTALQQMDMLRRQGQFAVGALSPVAAGGDLARQRLMDLYGLGGTANQQAQQRFATNLQTQYGQIMGAGQPGGMGGASYGGASYGGALGGSAPSVNWASYGLENPDVDAWARATLASGTGNLPPTYEGLLQWHFANYGQREGRSAPGAPQMQSGPQPMGGLQIGQRFGAFEYVGGDPGQQTSWRSAQQPAQQPAQPPVQQPAQPPVQQPAPFRPTAPAQQPMMGADPFASIGVGDARRANPLMPTYGGGGGINDRQRMLM